ncbi:MAG: hypothetical protein PVJ28_05760, partial [Acidimicrobiia bacterium]
IREYINATSAPLTLDEILNEQTITVHTPARPSSRRGLAVAVAAAAVVLAGLLPIWLTSGEPPAGTSPEPVPTTSPTPSTSPSVEIAPGGQLQFTAVPLPGGEYIGTGAWFQGTFYALGEEGNLYETSDGFTWQPISLDLGSASNDVPDSFRFTELEAGNDLMVVAGETEADNVGGESCETSDHLFQVTVIDSSGRATTSVPPLSIPTAVDCYSVNPSITVGPAGILISGSISSPPDSIPMETAFGIHSVDGTDWIDLGRIGPFSSAQVSGAFATSDGFFAAPTGPGGDGPFFFSSDGLTWTVDRVLSADDQHVVWDGQLLVQTSEGYAQYEDPTQILIPADPLRPSRLFFGQMGIIGGAGGGYGNDLPAHEPFAFSMNGIDWAIWQPPEFEDLGFAVSLIGMSDGFAVFSDWEGQQLWIGTPDS